MSLETLVLSMGRNTWLVDVGIVFRISVECLFGC